MRRVFRSAWMLSDSERAVLGAGLRRLAALPHTVPTAGRAPGPVSTVQATTTPAKGPSTT